MSRSEASYGAVPGAGTVGERWRARAVPGDPAVSADQRAAAATLGEFLTSAILGPVSAVAAETDPGGVQFRASLVVTQMLGLAMSRCVLKIGPVAAARPEQLAAAIGPTIDRYLTGDLGVPEGD